jgi:DNA-binding transcriptional ArsR family regulator
MSKEKFLLVSLSESKAKELAQAITNETCRKILDYLAEKDATESELAEKLILPISTVHYNLQQLQKGNLVTVEEFHYSQKGKEINHYKLANKYIIIAPKSTYGIKEKLKSILPVALIIAVGTLIIQFVSIIGSTARNAPMTLSEAAPIVGSKTADQAASYSKEIVQETTNSIVSSNQSILSNIALWFLIGAVSSLIIYLIVGWIRNKRN